jgi:hypothetical protein
MRCQAEHACCFGNPEAAAKESQHVDFAGCKSDGRV